MESNKRRKLKKNGQMERAEGKKTGITKKNLKGIQTSTMTVNLGTVCSL